MAILACALLLLQLSTVSTLPWTAPKRQHLLKLADNSHVRRSLPRSSLISNRVPALNDKKILNIACSKAGFLFINATIGNPPQRFHLSILLGFEEYFTRTWVPSKKCKEAACQKHQRYDSSTSKTYTPDGGKFSDEFTFASGFLSNDTICVEGVCADHHLFGEVTKEGDMRRYSDDDLDGFIDIDPYNSLFNSLLTEQMKDPIISLWFSHMCDQEDQTIGKIILGDVDSEFFSGSIAWLPMELMKWFPFTSATVGNTSLGCDGHCHGSVYVNMLPLINGPVESIKKLHAAIGAVLDVESQLFTVPCEKVSSLPQITFTIGNIPFVFGGNDYTQEVARKCYSMFTGSDESNDNIWSFGTAFLARLFPTNYPWQYEPRQTVTSNRAHALQDKKVLNVGCWKGNYYINATIGTPPQKFELALSLEGRDSPESTWVPSKQCDQPVCQLHHCYDSSASKTYAHNDKKFFDQNTLISGFLSNDTICLEDLCVPNQSFGEAVKEGKWNKYKNRGAPFDGFIDICVTHSLFRSILAEHIKDKTVSLWITGNPLQTNDSCGKLILGSIDRELFSGPITWVEPQYGTSFMFESVFMGDTRLGSNDDCTGFLETLSPYIKGPAKAIEKIHSEIDAVQDAKTKLFTVQCKLVPHFPEITFTIYDTPFSFKGTDYIGEMDGKCYSLFRSIETSRNFWQFGSAFFPRVYTIFDTQRKKIGFADAKHL